MSEHHFENHGGEQAQFDQPTAPEAPAQEATQEAQESAPKRPKAVKRAPARRGTQPELTWDEAERIFDFGREFDSGNQEFRSAALAVFGLDADSSPVALAQAVKPPSGGKVWAFETYASLARGVKSGQFGPVESANFVLELVTSTPEEVALFVNVSAVFGSGLEYRKNDSINTYIPPLFASLQGGVDQINDELLAWIEQLLAIYPGDTQ